MELIRGRHNLRSRHRGCAVTIGAFDGIHLGHQAVLAHLNTEAASLGVPTTVVTFEPLPREYLSPVEAPAAVPAERAEDGSGEPEWFTRAQLAASQQAPLAAAFGVPTRS